MKETIEYNGKTITKNQFICAMLQYGEVEGYSFDGFSAGMTWLSILNNERRKVNPNDSYSGQLERDIWLPVLEEYL